MIANFFWKGTLTNYQLASMLSFKKNGFDVILWSPDSHDVEKYGIQLKNSEDVIPLSVMDKVTQVSFFDNNKSGTYEKLACYSDIFRLKLLKQHEGIWSDCDVFCLKPVEEWVNLYNQSGDVFSGEMVLDNRNFCNTAVLGFRNKKAIEEIDSMVEKLIETKSQTYWGEVGPAQIDAYVRTNQVKLLDEHIFYPVPQNQWEKSFSTNPDDVNFCLTRSKDSFCIHWWNDALDHNGIKVLPEKNSYLGQLISTVINYVDKQKVSKKVALLKSHKERFKR